MNYHAANRDDYPSSQLQQPLAQGPDLCPRTLGPCRPQPQLMYQHPELIGPELGATGAVDLQAVMQFLEAILDVSALAMTCS